MRHRKEDLWQEKKPTLKFFVQTLILFLQRKKLLKPIRNNYLKIFFVLSVLIIEAISFDTLHFDEIPEKQVRSTSGHCLGRRPIPLRKCFRELFI